MYSHPGSLETQTTTAQGRNVELHSQVNQNILLSSANTLVSFLFFGGETSDGDCRKG